MFKWINDDGYGIELERILFQKGYLTFQDVKEIFKLEARNKMKTKYRIGFCFYYNHELCKVIGIFINEKAQILYKVSSILNKSVYYIILNQAQIDMIVEGKDNA